MAILAAAGIRHLFYTPSIGCMPPSRGVARTKCDIFSIELALEQFAADHDGRFPVALEALWTRDERGRKYLDVECAPLDRWKRPYSYEAPSRTGDAPRVFSLGKDGEPGGEREDADIGSAQIRAEDDSQR